MSLRSSRRCDRTRASIEETADYLDIPVEQAETAVRYDAAYRDEVDGWIERRRVIAERDRELWRRQQDVLLRAHPAENAVVNRVHHLTASVQDVPHR